MAEQLTCVHHTFSSIHLLYEVYPIPNFLQMPTFCLLALQTLQPQFI